MSEHTTTEIAAVGVRLLDEAYLSWLAAEIESEQALRAWYECRPGVRADAYCSYRAALDREEAAARDFERLSELGNACSHVLASA